MLRQHINANATTVVVTSNQDVVGPCACPQPGCQSSGDSHPYLKGYVVFESYGGNSGSFIDSEICKCCDGKGFLSDGEAPYQAYSHGANVSNIMTAYPNPIHLSRKVYDSIKVREQSAPAEKKNEGCYIATAVYGDYDSPEVKVFRKFRDEKLMPTLWGQCFVRSYYFLSPIFLKIFGNSSIMKSFAKKFLDSAYKNLKLNA